MPETSNHGYNVPNEGEQDWHVPLNENFEEYDTDIEIRDADGNRGNYDPKAGAKFLATDTETMYVGDGTNWNELESTGRTPEFDDIGVLGTVVADDVELSDLVDAKRVNVDNVIADVWMQTPGLNTGGDNLGIGTGSPATPLDIRGRNNWNLDNGDGDVRIGNDDYRLAIGVALGGAGAGGVNMRAKGGTNKINLGGGSTNVVTVDGSHEAIGVGTTTPGGSGQHGVGLHIKNANPTVSLDSGSSEADEAIEFLLDGDLQAWIEFDGARGVIVYRDLDVERNVDVGGDLNVSGDKNFVQPVDTDDGEREVVYTSTEAPTPRTEASGVAELEDGRAEIELPNHFGWVTDDEEPLHVQTTPYSADSGGLAVVDRSTDRLVFEDLDGEGDYEFSYTVKGTREGHADKQVVREPTAAADDGQSPTPADD